MSFVAKCINDDCDFTFNADREEVVRKHAERHHESESTFPDEHATWWEEEDDNQ